MNQILKVVLRYKNGIGLKGICIDLVPFQMKWVNDFVRIRNSEKNRYFFNQPYLITTESQRVWYEQYIQREDDIFWAVLKKSGEFIGTIRLYNIIPDKSILTQGSFMIDAEDAGEAPYALEAEVLSLDFAFQVLGIKGVINENRSDNKIMNNLSRKFGFQYIKDTDINGIPYKYYILNRQIYFEKRETVYSIIEYWGQR